MTPDVNRNLVSRYEFGFGEADQDRNIKIPIGTGCAGQAWLQGMPMVADFAALPSGGMPAQWGLPERELSKVRPSLRSVLSVPIRAGNDYDVVAVLNFDTDNSVDDIGFRDQAIQEIAYSFAGTLSALLDNSQ